MKVFENIKKWKSEIFLVAKADCSASWNFEQELEQIFKDLTGLRKNESLTRRYFETRLRYTTHSENHLRQFLRRKEKGEIKQSQEYSAYQPLTGEVVLPERFLLDIVAEFLGHFVGHVCVQQGAAYVFQGLGNVDLGDFAFTFEYLERALKPFAEIFEHNRRFLFE